MKSDKKLQLLTPLPRRPASLSWSQFDCIRLYDQDFYRKKQKHLLSQLNSHSYCRIANTSQSLCFGHRVYWLWVIELFISHLWEVGSAIAMIGWFCQLRCFLCNIRCSPPVYNILLIACNKSNLIYHIVTTDSMLEYYSCLAVDEIQPAFWPAKFNASGFDITFAN